MWWAQRGRQRPFVYAFFLGQFLALIERDGDIHLGFYQEMVLFEKTRKQHPVPIFVGALVRQVVDRVTSGPRIDAITEVACMCAQAPAQCALLAVHVCVGLVVLYRNRLQRHPGACLGHVSGFNNSSFELPAVLC